jgi:hypothetical protein
MSNFGFQEKQMNRKAGSLVLAALGSLIATTAAFADVATPSAAKPSTTQSMMGDHSGSMGMMGGMSGDHMAQMFRMIDNCNRMMESANDQPSGSDKAPDTHK